MKYDVVNYWSEIKLDIVRDYASAYSHILSTRQRPTLTHIYIDAFAGAGTHIARSTGDFIPGSPLNALRVVPPFKEYHFIDLDAGKADSLRSIAGSRPNVWVYEGDCNSLLLEKVFPRVRFESYRRGLCLLDPYGLHLNWTVIAEAGHMKSLEVFINFPVMDMNRNVLHNDPDSADAKQAARMTAFWGDETWHDAAYNTEGNLFGWEEKTGNEALAEAFRKRLQKVAGFAYVPIPVPMRNSKGATVYYLFFASQQPVAEKIVKDIFDKYRNRGLI
jgi:three-Cys-motif partner protein